MAWPQKQNRLDLNCKATFHAIKCILLKNVRKNDDLLHQAVGYVSCFWD